MAGELRVIVVDDDEWKRSGMAEHLDATSEVDVVDAVDQDTAASWSLDRWREVDAVLVDIFDDRAPGEVGTDLYSGGLLWLNAFSACPSDASLSRRAAPTLLFRYVCSRRIPTTATTASRWRR